MLPSSTLNDNRVTLLPLREDHVTNSYVSWLNDARVTALTEINAGQWTVDSVKEYVRSAEQATNVMMWGIYKSNDRKHIGNIRLSAISQQHRRASVAILIGDVESWGKGFSTHAITLLRSHAFHDLGLHKLCAGIYSNNIASRRAFEKAAFSLEATLTEHVVFGGCLIDVWMMAAFSEETRNKNG